MNGQPAFPLRLSDSHAGNHQIATWRQNEAD
jgi:hypothetical protein